MPEATSTPARLPQQLVITMAAMKGGAGKSTLAVAIACEWHRRGYMVVLVDVDIQQRSTMKWAERRKLFGVRGPPVMVYRIEDGPLADTIAGLDDYEIVIIDSPGKLGDLPVQAIGIADLVLMPCGPNGIEIESLEHTFKEVHDVMRDGREDLLARVLICKKQARTIIANQVRKLFDDEPFDPLETELDLSRDYGAAHEAGLGPTTWRPKSKAAGEVHRLTDELEKLLGMPRARKDLRVVV
jgi:chromosome partitioning protein